MKRYGNLYEKVWDMDNLRLAHHNARKGKAFYREVKKIDKNPEWHLQRIQTMLIDKTYHTSEYEMFKKTERDKEREICKLPYYPDRICQWALIQVIEPYLIKRFTDDTYSAIPFRGTHLAYSRMRKALSNDKEGTRYCLKLDVRKYYASIDHKLLKEKYGRLFKDKELLWLISEIIDSTEGDVGIPIGNYLSQYSGNFFLSDFDHWIKEVQGVKHYYRYMDDMVILGATKEELHLLFRRIRAYLRDNLKLNIKDNWQVFPVDVRGIDFLGYRCFRNFTLIRKSTLKAMKRKFLKYLKKCKAGGELTHKEWSSINSYYGWIIHCDSFRLREKYLEPLEVYYYAYYEKYLKPKGKR